MTDQRVWVMLHSGSRGVGNAIGTFFIELAKQDMRRWFINLPDEDLAYFPEGTDHFDDYVEAVGWAQDLCGTKPAHDDDQCRPQRLRRARSPSRSTLS